MSGSSTQRALEALGSPLRRRLFLAAVLGSVGVVLATLGAAAWLARLGVLRSPAWVLGAWGVAALATALVVRRALQETRQLRPAALAGSLETDGPFRRGAVRLLLEPPARGTSAGLMAAADTRQAQAIDQDGPAALASSRERLGRVVAGAAVATVTGGLLLVLASPASGTTSALWRPGAAWASLIAPIRLEASASVVNRGESVTLLLGASGRRDAVLWLRATGEAWGPRSVELDSLGRGEAVIGPLSGDLHARLTVGSRSSDTITVAVRLPLFLGLLEVMAEYPGYLGLDAEPLPLDGDTVLIPAGTRLVTTGRATGLLGGARWEGATEATRLTVQAEQFTGSFLPTEDGLWRLALSAEDGTPLKTVDATLAFILVPDLPPLVEVPAPGMDTVETTGPTLALVIDARDDHGLRRVRLETRKGAAPVQVQELELPQPMSDRALLNATIDLAGLGLVPGDTVRYRVIAQDNAPQPQFGSSREMVLIVPTRTELRDAQREATREAGGRLDELAEQSRALERATEDLSQARPRGDEGRRAGPEPLRFEDARRAEEIARAQEALNDEVRGIEQRMRDLEEAAEAAGIADSAFAKRMEEIREELARALSPELRERLAALQEAIKKLDAPAARQAMQELTESQRQLREALERSQELFKRAALEGELGALSQEAREVTAAQQELAQQALTADSSRVAAAEEALARRADSIAAGIERAAAQMASPGARQEMEQAAEAARSAAEQMRQAGQSAQKGQRQQSSNQGRQAASQMEQAQQQVDQSRGEQQEAWREEVLKALDQALLETTRLTTRQLALAQAFRRAQPAAALRAEQAAVEEGARQLIEQVMNAGGQNALVPPQIAGALAAARQQMGLAREAIATANLNLREGGERAGEAVDALNVAAFMLLRARSDVSGSSSGSGMAEAMERMAQMAQQQGGVGQESASLLPMMGSAGADQRLQEVAARQRQLSRDLDRLRAETNAGAAEEFAAEARELARELEGGRLDPATIARQERLFRRMLDAGRTLQGEEEDERKERESRRPENAEVRLPPALRSRFTDGAGAVRLPTWEELQRLSPEERRLVADYFRRLTGRGR